MKMDQPGGYMFLQRFQRDMRVAWIRLVAVETVGGGYIEDNVVDVFHSSISHPANVTPISNVCRLYL